jgi:subtilisin family serine protease
MPDHGLFVAGLVRDLAPAADVHLIRVLGDYGVGTLQGLAHVLNRLPGTLNPGGTRRLIVNLSLMVDIPTSWRIVSRWFPGLSGDEYKPNVLGALGHLDVSVRASIDALNRLGVLVVAAAGNDALPTPAGPPNRPLPRHPARIESVLSVGALTRDGTPTSYSNQATVPPLSPFGPATSNGVAVFGGEASLRSGWAGPAPAPTNPPVPGLPALLGPRFVEVPPTGAADAVAGIVSAARLPMGKIRNPTTGTTTPTNPTGWVYWVGTSFATPIVSALAAAVWELDTALPPVDLAAAGPSVRAKVQAFALGPTTALGCRGLEVKQV